MANEKKEWKELLEFCNKDLKLHGYEMHIFEEDLCYGLNILNINTGETNKYAQGYFEEELVNLINDANCFILSEIVKNPHKENIYLLQAVDEEDDYKLTVMATNVTPTKEIIVKQIIDTLGIEDDDEDQPLGPIAEDLCNFDAIRSFHFYSLFWETTTLFLNR